MKLDGSVGILGNGAGLSMSTVDVVVVAGGRPANFCDLGGGGSAEGVVAALEVIAQRPAGALDPLQHLRRDHPLRRGRARDPRPRSTRIELDGPDRRPPRRHERRRGPADPRRRRPAEHPRSSRRCSTRPGAPWSWRGVSADDPGASARSSTGRARRTAGARPRPGRRVGRRLSDGDRRRDRRRACRPAAARGGLEVVSCDPAPGMRPDVICFAEELPFADASFDARGDARRRASLRRRRRQAVRELGARGVASGGRRRTRSTWASGRAGRGLRDPSHVATTARTSGGRSSTGAGLEIEEVRRFVELPIEFEAWLERTGCTGETAGACARSWPTGSTRRAAHARPDRAPRGRPPDGDPRRRATRAWSSRG